MRFSRLAPILLGLGAALAYLPVYWSPFYNLYQLNNYIRFTGIGISLADIALAAALIFGIISRKKLKLNLREAILLMMLLLPIWYSLTFSLLPMTTLSFSLRVTAYTLLGMYLIQNRADLKYFIFGFIGLIPTHLMAIFIQRLNQEEAIGLTVNANLVSGYAVISLALILLIYIGTRHRGWLLLTMAPLIIIALILSRGAVIASALVIILSLIYSLNVRQILNSLRPRKEVLIAISMLAILALVSYTGADDRRKGLFITYNRIDNENTLDAVLSGRLENSDYHSRYARVNNINLLSGYGAGAYTAYTDSAPPHSQSITNIYELSLPFAIIHIAVIIILALSTPVFLIPGLILGAFSYLTSHAEGIVISYILFGLAIKWKTLILSDLWLKVSKDKV